MKEGLKMDDLNSTILKQSVIQINQTRSEGVSTKKNPDSGSNYISVFDLIHTGQSQNNNIPEFDDSLNTDSTPSMNPSTTESWNSNVAVYASTRADEIALDEKNGSSTISNFTNFLTQKMKDDNGNVRSLAEAYNNVSNPILTKLEIKDPEKQTLANYGIKVFFQQHPDCSGNGKNDTEGWVSKKHDPNRTSKAILIVGDSGGDTLSGCDFDNSEKMIENSFKDNYDLKDKDIKVLRCPTKEDIKNTMDTIQADAGNDSQVMVYYAGHGNEDFLCNHSATADDTENIDKPTLINDVNTLSHKFNHTICIFDCCKSGAYKK